MSVVFKLEIFAFFIFAEVSKPKTVKEGALLAEYCTYYFTYYYWSDRKDQKGSLEETCHDFTHTGIWCLSGSNSSTS